jgi:hypothetical protein
MNDSVVKDCSVEIPSMSNSFNHKFILIKETMPDKSTRMAVVCMPLEFHKYIATVLLSQGRIFKVRGGGRLSFDHEQKCLKAYGESVDYGGVDKDVLDSVLTDWCEENNIKFKNKIQNYDFKF